MSDISYYTEEGYKALKDEVHHLVSVERPKISAQIGEAIDKGDLSENAEYDAAKDAQGHLEAKIAKMENLLANARIIDDSKIDNSKVFILSIVKIRNNKNSENKPPSDEDIVIHICGKSLMHVIGTHIDWERDIMGEAFKFDNPMAKSSCGCGTSFTPSNTSTCYRKGDKLQTWS